MLFSKRAVPIHALVPDIPGSLASGGDKSKKRRLSPASTVVSDDEKDCIRAKIALEYYNKENGTSYVLAGSLLLSNGFISDGAWAHCNFSASQPNGDMNGKSSRKLFFAEISGDDDYPMTWTVTCCVLLRGNTTIGCSFCSDAVHPPHGFCQGYHKPKFSFQPTTPTSTSAYSYPLMPTQKELKPYAFQMREESVPERRYMEPAAIRRAHAKSAVETYNLDNGTNYEVVDSLLTTDVLSDGRWYHINFTAKKPNEDISPKLFFAEIYFGDSYAVTACLMVEDRSKTSEGCKWCSEGKHPSGFISEARAFGDSVYSIYDKPKTITPIN